MTWEEVFLEALLRIVEANACRPWRGAATRHDRLRPVERLALHGVVPRQAQGPGRRWRHD